VGPAVTAVDAAVDAKPATAEEAYDCQAALRNWEAEWSEEKKIWCCQHELLGCPTAAAAPATQTPAATPVTAAPSKSVEVAAEPATTAAGPAAPAVEPAAQAEAAAGEDAFDCQAALRNFEAEWSDEKKSWCCKREHLGCTTATSAPATQAEQPQSMSKSSGEEPGQEDAPDEPDQAEQPQSTAVNSGEEPGEEGEGDEPDEDDEEESTDCQADHIAAWSTDKREYCCRTEGIGCPKTSAELQYDCEEGRPQAWSEAKRSWCCRHEQRGCPASSSGAEAPPSLEERASPSSGPGLYFVGALSLGMPAVVYFFFCRNSKDARRYSGSTGGSASKIGRPSSSYTQMRSYSNSGTYVPPGF